VGFSAIARAFAQSVPAARVLLGRGPHRAIMGLLRGPPHVFGPARASHGCTHRAQWAALLGHTWKNMFQVLVILEGFDNLVFEPNFEEF
jgi:hypothetical protein